MQARREACLHCLIMLSFSSCTLCFKVVSRLWANATLYLLISHALSSFYAVIYPLFIKKLSFLAKKSSIMP